MIKNIGKHGNGPYINVLKGKVVDECKKAYINGYLKGIHMALQTTITDILNPAFKFALEVNSFNVNYSKLSETEDCAKTVKQLKYQNRGYREGYQMEMVQIRALLIGVCANVDLLQNSACATSVPFQPIIQSWKKSKIDAEDLRHSQEAKARSDIEQDITDADLDL